MKTPRILLVDDDAVLAARLGEVLTEMGWTVEIINNAFQIVRVVSVFQPDLVLMDVNMPGFDGGSAARLLDHLSADGRLGEVAVMLVSAMDAGKLEEIRAETGAIGALHKSMSPEAMAEKVRVALLAMGIITVSA